MISDKERFTHISEDGQVRMTDVGTKAPSVRMARAEAIVHLGDRIAQMLKRTGAVDKGNVMETARIAGIMAAKRTSDLIPMCHPLPIDAVHIGMMLEGSDLRIETRVACRASTGVEMEAMTAASVAALTVYDMCKSAGKGISIGSVRLLEKTGGRSGHWRLGGADDGQD